MTYQTNHSKTKIFMKAGYPSLTETPVPPVYSNAFTTQEEAEQSPDFPGMIVHKIIEIEF